MSAVGVPLGAPGLLSPTECERHLNLYRDGLELGNGTVALFALPAKQCFASLDPTQIRDRAMAWSDGSRDVYIHTHLHRLPLGDHAGRGSIKTASIAIGVISDVDARGPKRKKDPSTLCPTVADALAVAEEFERLYGPVSVVINSGHGCYPILLFREPFLIMTDDDRERLNAIARRFHEALDRITAGHGWTGAVDFCDMAKVIRLGGTINSKDPDAPMAVRFASENPARYNISDLEEMLPESATPKLFPVAISTGTKDRQAEHAAHLMSAPTPPTKRLIAALTEFHFTFGTTWNYARTDLKDTTCSGYDMALAGIGVGFGLKDDQIAGLLVENRLRFPREKQNRQGSHYMNYLARTIAKARASQPDAKPLDLGPFADTRSPSLSEAPQLAPGDRVPAAGTPGQTETVRQEGLEKCESQVEAFTRVVATPELQPPSASPTVLPGLHQPTASGEAGDLLEAASDVAALTEAAQHLRGESNGPKKDADKEAASRKLASKTGNESQASNLIKLTDSMEFFHSPDKKAFASYLVNGHREVYAVKSSTFKLHLQGLFYATRHTAIGSKALADGLGVLEAKARFDGPEHPVFMRVGEHTGEIYLDPGTDKWSAIRINARGWEIIPAHPDVRFIRSNGMLPMPSPVRAEGALRRFRELTNIHSRADFMLLVGWLIAAMRPTGPYPILVLRSGHGNGKSTLSRMCRALLDPSDAPLRALPRDEQDLAIAAMHCGIVAFDNVTRLHYWLSDALCRLSTGGGFGARELYTNDEEILFAIQRPTLINGIGEVLHRPDLRDRSIQIEPALIRRAWHDQHRGTGKLVDQYGGRNSGGVRSGLHRPGRRQNQQAPGQRSRERGAPHGVKVTG